jgi:hypothetical protein
MLGRGEAPGKRIEKTFPNVIGPIKTNEILVDRRLF